MTANQTIVLYRAATKEIIAEVHQGEKYYIPSDVSVFNGSLDEFLQEYSDYKYHEFEL